METEDQHKSWLAEQEQNNRLKAEEGELEAHKGDGKQDGRLEEIKVVDTETPKSVEDGKDKPKDSLCINTTSISSPSTPNKQVHWI